jgi:hypothetical protein
VRVKDDFVRIPFPRVAAVSDRQIVAATEAYKREAAVVDARLAREVTVAAKGMALSDLCERLKTESGIEVRSGNSVADEKVTVFCGRTPLREVMRQLGRPFGYTWLRSGKAGEYRYELAQDLKSQLLEGELRNRDRHQALLALEKEIERFRPYLSLSPDEALAKARSAAPAEKELLEKLSGKGWGALQMYGRLSSQEMGMLLSGQPISFSEAPRPGEQGFVGPSTGVLPSDIGRGVLQSMRYWRLVKSKGEGGVEGYEYTPDATTPGALPPSVIPSCRGRVVLSLDQSELGHSKLSGASYLYTIASNGRQYYMGGGSAGCAVGISPTVLQPNNAVLNARLAREPSLRARVTVEMAAEVSRRPVRTVAAAAGDSGRPPAENKIIIADALEALHRSTGLPIVADQYTRLYSSRAVAVRNKPIFEALNQLADTMRLRWNKEDGWLQFRSTSYYDDRLKEVPNRLLARWTASREQHGKLTLDDLCEIAQLPDAQLDGSDMAEGARDYYGLAEWDLARSPDLRPHLRFLAQLTPALRQEAAGADGLLFTRMPLAQQQRFMAMGLRGGPLQSLDELARATLRVSYTQPGGYQWGEAGWSGFYTRWVIPMGPEREDARVPRPPVVAPTREEALAAVRQVDPKLREALWQAVRRADPRLDGSQEAFEAEQIFPTKQDLWIVYVPGGTNSRPIYVVGRAVDGECHYRQR